MRPTMPPTASHPAESTRAAIDRTVQDARSILPWQDLRGADGHAPCIVALHGSFGEPRDWKLVASRLQVPASMHAVALAPMAQCSPLDMPHAAAMVARTVASIRALRPGAPLVLAGYSFGGRLAAAATAVTTIIALAAPRPLATGLRVTRLSRRCSCRSSCGRWRRCAAEEGHDSAPERR